MKQLYVLILVFVLAGCSILKPAAEVTGEAAYLNNEFAKGNIQQDLMSIDLTQNQEQLVTHALNKIAYFRTSYGHLVDNPAKLVALNESILVKDYKELKVLYSQLVEVVEWNWDKYDSTAQMNLLNYQKHAVNLDEAVETLLEKKEFRKAVKNILSYGFTALQVIASFK